MFANFETDMQDLLAQLPRELPVLPLRNTVAFPGSMLLIVVGSEKSLKLAKDVINGDRLVMLVTTHEQDVENPASDEVYEVGVVAMIQRSAPTQNGEGLQLFVQTAERARIDEWVAEDPYLKAQVSLAPETDEDDTETEALNRSLLSISREMVALLPNVPDQIVDALEQIDSNLILTYTIAANARIGNQKRVEVLDLDSVNEKMKVLLDALAREKEVLEIGQEIKSRAQDNTFAKK